MPLHKVISKPISRHTSTIIFLHGLGESGHTWISMLEHIRSKDMKIICPTATAIPVTIFGGAKVSAWFDIISMDITKPSENEASMNYSKNKIHTLINNERKKGIYSNRILLGGFSLGGALALYSALTYPIELGGVIALSCWLPLHLKFPDYVVAPQNIPIFQGHGDDDMICPLPIGQLTNFILKTYSRNAQIFVYNDLAHTVSIAEANDIKIFISEQIKPLERSNNRYCCCFSRPDVLDD